MGSGSHDAPGVNFCSSRNITCRHLRACCLQPFSWPPLHACVQDLELWLTKEEVADGFNLVARAGRVVQEIHVVTELTKDDMKQTVQRVLARLV